MYYKSDNGPVRVNASSLSKSIESFEHAMYAPSGADDKKIPYYRTRMFWIIMIAVVVIAILVAVYMYTASKNKSNKK